MIYFMPQKHNANWTALDIQNQIRKRIQGHLRVRLVEEKMSYEDIAVEDNFSDNEVTFSYYRDFIRDKQYKTALKNVFRIEQQLSEIKRLGIKGMQVMSKTINSIDENSKKIVFKHFDQANVNISARETPSILDGLQKIADEI